MGAQGSNRLERHRSVKAVLQQKQFPCRQGVRFARGVCLHGIRRLRPLACCGAAFEENLRHV